MVFASLCPYCGSAFEKPPQRGTKCKSCGKPVLVRTNPEDRQRILVTETQAKQLEEQWALKYEYSRVIRRDRPGFEAERELLAKKFGGPPSCLPQTSGIAIPDDDHPALSRVG